MRISGDAVDSRVSRALRKSKSTRMWKTLMSPSHVADKQVDVTQTERGCRGGGKMGYYVAKNYAVVLHRRRVPGTCGVCPLHRPLSRRSRTCYIGDLHKK